MAVVISGFGVRRKLRVIYFSVFSLWLLISDEDCAPDSTVYSVSGLDVQAHEFRLRGCSYYARYVDDMSWFCRINRLQGTWIHWAIAWILYDSIFRHHIQKKSTADFCKWLYRLIYTWIVTEYAQKDSFLRPTKPPEHSLKKQAVIRRPAGIRRLSQKKRFNPLPHITRQNGSVCVHCFALSIVCIVSFLGDSEREFNRNPRTFKSRCPRALVSGNYWIDGL